MNDHDVEICSDFLGADYYASCSCGWTTHDDLSLSEAMAAAAEHTGAEAG